MDIRPESGKSDIASWPRPSHHNLFIIYLCLYQGQNLLEYESLPRLGQILK
jgi:hypothetical protein